MANDGARLASYSTALVTDSVTNEVIGESSEWTDAVTGEPVTDPAWLKRLETKMSKVTTEYDESQAVELLENDDETWTPARFYRDQGNGVYLVRKADTGQLIGVPTDRLRAANDAGKDTE